MDNKAELAKASDVFDQFCAAQTLKSIVGNYRLLCDLLKVRPTHFSVFYPTLKAKLKSWKAQGLWAKFDKRAGHKCYNKGRACNNLRVLVIGGGPCGLRCAIEAQLLGAKVVLVEKRDRISRNNVLHLWPFVIHDLKALGAKKFFGKFCAGAIDHISIRQLQCILLKVALLLGVEFHESVSFEKLREPECEEGEEENGKGYGWRAYFTPSDHPVSQYEFDFIVGADGKRNTLHGFGRKEFRGRLAIAITANFINKHTEAEARVEEISGVAYIFNQSFFNELSEATGIDLENIVYYKDDTHYFVMTAKKHSLLRKGVILHDYADTLRLLSPENVDREALFDYAREAADFSTRYKLPHLDFAVNHYGQPDVAMFDFTSMYAAENACRVIERKGYKLVMNLVGDSLLEPFWPTGSGCARGFLSSMDTAWMMRSWSSGKMTPLQVIAERESIYRLLGQTTPENISRDFNSYTLDPHHRYPNLNTKSVLPFQIRAHFDTDSRESVNTEAFASDMEIPRKRKRRESAVNPDTLLRWLQVQLALCDDVKVTDLTQSFRDGRALARILQRYRPELVEDSIVLNMSITDRNQFVFDLCEQHLSIPPVMTGKEMSEASSPDLLTMTSYLSQIYWCLRGQVPCVKQPSFNESIPTSKEAKSTILNRIGHRVIGTNRKRYSLERERENTDRKDSSLKRARKKDRIHHMKDSDAAELLKYVKGLPVGPEKLSDRVKTLEDKLNRRNTQHSQKHIEKKPKEMIRAIGKIESNDWNVRLINKKLDEQMVAETSKGSEHVPKWNRDKFKDKFSAMEKKLVKSEDKESAENFMERFSKIDSELKMLGTKIREGSTLEVGTRGNNKVAAMAGALAKKLESSAPQNGNVQKSGKGSTESSQVSNPAVMSMANSRSGSETCHFCNKRVYLMERMSAEMKFFHRGCFKCEFCGTLLRLGNYSYDRDSISGGKFLCSAHFGMSGLGRMKAKEKADSMMFGLTSDSSGPESDGLFCSRDAIDNAVELEIPLPAPDLINVTPERVEYETAVMDLGSEDEVLSEIDEDEFTDRNFGNSTADTSDDALSDFSSESDGEDNLVVVDEIDKPLTVDQTRELVNNWKRRYSESHLLSDGEHQENEAKDEGKFEDYEDQNGDIRLEVPQTVLVTRQAANEDSESDTEIGSDGDELEDEEEEDEDDEDEDEDESDTEIETDPEFEMDSKSPVLYDIPTIVIEESKPGNMECHLPAGDKQVNHAVVKPINNFRLEDLEKMKPVVNRPSTSYKPIKPISYDQHLKKVFDTKYDNPMQRIENLLNSANKSNSNASPGMTSSAIVNTSVGKVSEVTKTSPSPRLDERFKSFMDIISQNQKLLNPAPAPSPSMQAYLSGPKANPSSHIVTSVNSIPSWTVTSTYPLAEVKSINATETVASPIPENSLKDSSILEGPPTENTRRIVSESVGDDIKSGDVFDNKSVVMSEDEDKDVSGVGVVEILQEEVNAFPGTPNESYDDEEGNDELLDPLNTAAFLESPRSADASCHLLTEMEEEVDKWAVDSDVISTTDEAKMSGIEKPVCPVRSKVPMATLATFDDELFSLDMTEDVEGKFEALLTPSPKKVGGMVGVETATSIDQGEEMDFMDVSEGDEVCTESMKELKSLGYERLNRSTPSSPSCEAVNPKLIPYTESSASDYSSSSTSSRSHPSSCYADNSDKTVMDELNDKLLSTDIPASPVNDDSEVFCTPFKKDVQSSAQNSLHQNSVYVTPDSNFNTPMVSADKNSDYVPFSRTQTPFSGIRDSIGIRKSAMKKSPPIPPPPSEEALAKLSSSRYQVTDNLPSLHKSPVDYHQKRMEDRDRQRDLVKEMVLSRIKSPERKDRKSVVESPPKSDIVVENRSVIGINNVPNVLVKSDLDNSDSSQAKVSGIRMPGRQPVVEPETPAKTVKPNIDSSETPFKTPSHQQWNYYKNLRTVEKEKARCRARLKSDEELGLSPPSGYSEVKEKLRLRSASKSQKDGDRNLQILSEPSTPVKSKPFGTNIFHVLRNAKSNVDLSFSSVTHPLIDGDVPQPAHKITRQMYENLNVFTSRSDRPTSLDVGQLLGNSNAVDYGNNVCVSPSDNSAESGGSGSKSTRKKSKDPARRKSLIQAISGLFNKSTDSSGGSNKESRSPTPTLSSQSDSGKKQTNKDRFIGIKFRSKYKDKDGVDKGKSPDKENQPPKGEEKPKETLKNNKPTREGAGNISASDDEVSFSTNLSPSSHYYGSLDKKTRTARKVARQNEMKRLRKAQEIQRKLEELEVKQRELEKRGVLVERSLREANQTLDETDKMTEWFSLVHEKSKLDRQEQELLIKARELELEDRHSRLQQELRDIMQMEESQKTIEDVEREGEILKSILDVVSQRDALVTLIEEDRQRHKEEDQDLEAVMSSKGIHIPRETGV